MWAVCFVYMSMLCNDSACSNVLQMFSFTVVVWFVAVPVIARVAVQFVTSSSLEVVTQLTTNGGRDILYYHVGFGCCVVFLGIVSGFSFNWLEWFSFNCRLP